MSSEGLEHRRRQRGKNIAVAAFLLGLVVLFFFITLYKLGGLA